MINTKLPNEVSESLSRNYPKAVEEFISWIKDKVSGIASISSSSDWFSDLENLNTFAEITLRSNFRVLYDFFDEKRIHISIGYTFETGFESQISGTDYDDTSYNTRPEAEAAVFQRAFKILNDRL